jgi:uncharacterized protein (DUF983 family)
MGPDVRLARWALSDAGGFAAAACRRRQEYRIRQAGKRAAVSTLLGILVLVAIVWIIIVIAAHLPVWLLLLLLILVLIGFLG